jgi:hypothetical protein
VKRLIICAALLGACSQEPDVGPPAELAPVSLPVADQAGNRMEALTQTGSRWCTADGAWCVESTEAGASSVHGATTLALGPPVGSDVWPNIIRNADGSVVVGFIRRENQMFSGGGAETSELLLYSIANGAAQEAGALPYSGAASIRACFSEEHTRNRRDACHDEYDFTTRISLNEGAARGPAQILLETAATTFPGRVSRDEDSTERAPLQASDLARWVDATCSYRRTYIRGADGRYAPDEPLPDCSQYLEP